MENTTIKINCSEFKDGNEVPMLSTAMLDGFEWNGKYRITVSDDDGSLGLPFLFATDDTAILTVETTEQEGMGTGDKKIKQVISCVPRSLGNEITCSRIRSYNGKEHVWSAWETISSASGTKVDWGASSCVDTFITAGIYNISGDRLNVKDGLPIANSNPGHTINARLVVIDSSISGIGDTDDKCITQILTLSNRTGGNSDVYIRTGRAHSTNVLAGGSGWEPWGKLQQNIEVGQVTSLNNFIGNGIYSGVYTNGSSFFETFVMVVINDYAVAGATGNIRCISQFKYALNVDGTFSYKTRTGRGSTDIEWGSWVDLGAADTTDIQDGAITAQKLSSDVRDKVEHVGQQQSINIVRSAYTDYKIVLPKGCVITDLGGYDGNLFLSTAYPYDNNSRVTLNKDLLPFDVPIDVQSIYPNKDIDSTIIIETGLRAASLDVKKSRAFKCVVIASGYGANSYIPVNNLVAMDKGRVLVSVQGATLPKYLWLGAAGSSQADATKIAVTELPFVLPFDVKKLWLDISTLSQPVSLITISADSEEYRELVQDKRIASIENNLAELTPRSYAMPRISGDMPDGTVLTLEKNSVKTFKSLAFSADIVSFGEDGRLLLGHGRESENRYGASWVEVDSKYLVVKTWLAAGNIQERYYEHGLTLSGNIQVLMSVGAGSLSVKISSGGASYEKGELEWNCNGTIFAETAGCELSNASLSWACKNITADIWAFGDSYFGTTNESRWIKHLLDAGYHNILVNGYAGEASSDALADLNALLQHGTPKYIFWCLGMNNADTSTAVDSTWKSVLESVKALCNENGIELVLATIPTVPSRVNKYKNAVVRSSGYRFVDFDKAVGADESTGAWYDGMLSSDGVHPSSKGAVALFHRAIADFPELMMAKRME